MWRNGRGQQQEGDQEVGGVLHGRVQYIPHMVAADDARVVTGEGGVQECKAGGGGGRQRDQPGFGNPGEPRGGGGPGAWRGGRQEEEKGSNNTYLSLLRGSQEKEVGKQKICSMIRREIQMPGQLILRASRSWQKNMRFPVIYGHSDSENGLFLGAFLSLFYG